MIIIDGNALIHRSFHALPTTLKTKNGQISNAAYGFTSFLIKALNEIKPGYAVLTLDRKAPTFRHQAYDRYKATRSKAPAELYDQIPMIKKIVQAFAIPIFEMDGYEADDLIGTIAAEVNRRQPKVDVIIITGDLDTLQLVNERTRVYTMSRGLSEAVWYDIDRIKERFGLQAKQIIDLKALKGDASDNIPGVAGIGEKTAIELLQKFSDLDRIYENINSGEIKNRTRELLLANQATARLSRKLATIDLKVPLDFSIESARIKSFDKQAINSVFSQLEFRSLLGRILSLKQNKDVDKNELDKFQRNQKLFRYRLIKTQKDLSDWLEKIKKEKVISLDTETTSLNPLSARLLGISFSWKKDEACFVQLSKQGQAAGIDHPFLTELKKILENKELIIVGHNIKYDWQVLKNYHLEIKGRIFDTMIASYLLNPENRQHSLDALSFYEFNWEKISSDDLMDSTSRFKDFSLADPDKLGEYSCEDADFTLKLKEVLEKKLRQQGLQSLFENIELPLIPILADLERNGIMLDTAFLKKLGQDIKKKIKTLTGQIFELAGREFNLNSTQQLKQILYEEMAINPTGLKKNKTGWSTAAEELEKIKHLHPILGLIQDYRELNKLTSTYIDALPKLLNQNSGRIHTNFNQSITATGRLSSSDPNLQNIPTRTDLGRQIRRAFIVPPKRVLLSLDYSQIELRIMAHLSGDKNLLKAFQKNLDIHRSTAATINQIPLEEVTDRLRYQAKTINFGLLYGQGPHGLSRSAGLSYQEAREFIEKYFSFYPGVKKFIDDTIVSARATGYTETIFGRRRSIPDINSSETIKKKAAERMAVNSPIQGSAADIIKIAMRDVYREIESQPEEIKMLLQVHDELIFEVNEDRLKYYWPRIKEIMENIVKLKVPLIAEVASGKNWGDLKKNNIQ